MKGLFQKSFKRLIIRLWLLLINDKTIASKECEMRNNINISFNDLESDSKLFTRSSLKLIFSDYLCKRFEKFGINYEKELLFELFCKIYKYRVDSESLSLDFCGNHLKNM
jgi:hypothetical protein